MTGETNRGPDRRQDAGPDESASIHARLTAQDQVMREMRDLLVAHITEEKDIGPALRELVGLWRASKLLGVVATVLAGGVASLWAAVSWLREHGLRL
jgi:hypothetical protein